MAFMSKVIRFPWQSTVNLTLQAGAQIEAVASIKTTRAADVLRDVINEGLPIVVAHLRPEQRKSYESLVKTLLEQSDLRKAIAGDGKKK